MILHKQLYLNCRAIVLLMVHGGFAQDPAKSAGRDPSDVGHFCDILDAAVASATPKTPYSFVAEYETTTLFEEAPVSHERFVVRVHRDDEQSRYCYAMVRDGKRSINGEKRLIYRSADIWQTNVYVTTNGHLEDRKSQESYQQAVKKYGFLDPRYWSFSPFPDFDDSEADLQQLKAEAYSRPDDFSIRPSSEAISLVMKFFPDKSVTDTLTYRFSLPDYHLTDYKLVRAVDGYPDRVSASQSVIWSNFKEEQRPSAIFTETTAVRRSNDNGVRGISLGKIESDLQVVWLSQEAIPEFGVFDSNIAIDDYIEQGRNLAKLAKEH